jgi:hypothetical protein
VVISETGSKQVGEGVRVRTMSKIEQLGSANVPNSIFERTVGRMISGKGREFPRCGGVSTLLIFVRVST